MYIIFCFIEQFNFELVFLSIVVHLNFVGTMSILLSTHNINSTHVPSDLPDCDISRAPTNSPTRTVKFGAIAIIRDCKQLYNAVRQLDICITCNKNVYIHYTDVIKSIHYTDVIKRCHQTLTPWEHRNINPFQGKCNEVVSIAFHIAVQKLHYYCHSCLQQSHDKPMNVQSYISYLHTSGYCYYPLPRMFINLPDQHYYSAATDDLLY